MISHHPAIAICCGDCDSEIESLMISLNPAKFGCQGHCGSEI